MSASNIAGKVAWVTGASSGIGEAVARALAERNAVVVLSARREKELRQVQDSCPRSQEHLVLALDMLNPSSFDPAAQKVLDRFGRIDLIVHCAGVSQRGRAADTQMAVDRQIMEVDYFGPVALTKAVLPSMIQRHAGHIVVVSSLLGKFGSPDRSAYCAAKHALHGFFDSLRAEVDSAGITVTTICPGYARTNASFHALTADGSPHGRMDREIERGLDAGVVARHIVRAIEHRRREVYIGGKERLGVYFSRFAPGAFSRFIRRRKK